MADASSGFCTMPDGTRVAWHRMGAGRPLMLLHGLFSNAEVNWIKYGHAERLAAAGFDVIMPDFRAHGGSDAPHDPAAYPADILVQDVAALVDHFGFADYDLGGFSLGARTAARAVISGLTPRRLVLGGMGLSGLAGWTDRGDYFRRVIAEYDVAKRGDDTWFAIQFMKTMKIDRIAAGHLLASFANTDPAMLARITMPTLVVCGDKDFDNGSAADLAEALPDAQHVVVPGTHMSSVTEAALGEAMAAFLNA